ncbi:hypothetical protein HGM15179_012169, partial [Zosterops borbonicus]
WQDSDAKMYNTTTTGKIEKKLCVLIWILPSNISLPTRILSRLSPWFPLHSVSWSRVQAELKGNFVPRLGAEPSGCPGAE